MDVNRFGDVHPGNFRDTIRKSSAFPHDVRSGEGVNWHMNVLPTLHQTLVRIVTLAVATTTAALLLITSLLGH